jgi:hypothetical protein
MTMGKREQGLSAIWGAYTPSAAERDPTATPPPWTDQQFAAQIVVLSQPGHMYEWGAPVTTRNCNRNPSSDLMMTMRNSLSSTLQISALTGVAARQWPRGSRSRIYTQGRGNPSPDPAGHEYNRIPPECMRFVALPMDSREVVRGR